MTQLRCIAITIISLALGGGFLYSLKEEGNYQQRSMGLDHQYDEIEEVRPPVGVTTYNSQGKQILSVYDHIPKRVIVNRINNVETMIALGVQSHILATNMQNTDWKKPYALHFQEEGEKLQKVTYRDMTMEEALWLEPDCIIGWKSTFRKSSLGTTEFWNSRDVSTYIQATSNRVKPYGKVSDEIQYIYDMGKIFHVESKADALASHMKAEIHAMQAMYMERNHPHVMVIEFQGREIINYGEEWLVGDMVKMAGGQLTIPKSGEISYEDLIVANPDVVFVVYFNGSPNDRLHQITQNPIFNSLRVVRENRVYPLRLDYMYATGVRTVEGLKILRDGLYPDLAGI